MNLAEQDTEIQRGARCLGLTSNASFLCGNTNSIERESCFYKLVSGLQGCELALLLKTCSLRFLLGAGNKKTLICKINLFCQLSMYEMQFYCGETIKFIFKSQIGRIHLRGANKIALARDNVITMAISYTKKYFYICTYQEMSLFYNVNFLGFFLYWQLSDSLF